MYEIAGVAKPAKFLTSGSNIAAVNNPVWCSVNEPIKTADFPWNTASGGTMSTDPTKYIVVLAMGTTAASVHLMNQADLGDAYAVCEEYGPYD